MYIQFRLFEQKFQQLHCPFLTLKYDKAIYIQKGFQSG